MRKDLNAMGRKSWEKNGQSVQRPCGQTGSLKHSQGTSEWLQGNKGENRGGKRSQRTRHQRKLSHRKRKNLCYKLKK